MKTEDKNTNQDSPKNGAARGQLDTIVRLDLVHYGNSKYDPSKFTQINGVNSIGIKPRGGLWASPVDSDYGWREWCRDNGRGDLTKKFFFEFVGRLLVVDSVDDMMALPWTGRDDLPQIDFMKIIEGYDAMMVTAKGENDTRFTFPKSLYGWDCESVVIFNKGCIVA